MRERAKTEFKSQAHRFTLDGSDQLESHLAKVCHQVLEQIRLIIGDRMLEALVLGGGYGRGQGGVVKSPAGDSPYNDMEFYAFVRGNRIWQERRCRAGLAQCAQKVGPEAGVHIEVKIDSMQRLKRSPITMFSYDLVTRHRIVFGDQDLFRDCSHHLAAATIPLAEATRLLFNRCTGLLLSKELLQESCLTLEQADFVGRNLAKAQLALGDAVLTACGQYHWDCLKRHQRMEQLRLAESRPWLRQVQALHRKGVEFKLRPRRGCKSAVELQAEHSEIAELALQVWLWLEARRLNCEFSNASEYAFYEAQKCAETSVWKNWLLNVRTFGLPAVLESYGRRYPRERLFNALSLLLWVGEENRRPQETRLLQRQLHCRAYDWAGLVKAYKQIWPQYG